MVRRLSADEAALWRKVVESVRPLAGEDRRPDPAEPPKLRPEAAPPPGAAKAPSRQKPQAGARANTLDGSWDRQLSKGQVQPDLTVDLHGHNLATAHDLLDRKLEQAILAGARTLLLITGKAPSGPASKRGAIRAAVGDWLGASRHSSDIAAVRNAHPKHGGSGALYIILRRQRTAPSG
jgi:DNA-nicking Smr family endonuclease